jgi:chromosome partitioning protein
VRPAWMQQMAIVVVFVSQKGGVGKSTMARALATSAVRAGLAVKAVDLDPDQATITVWAQTRDRYKVLPSIKVDAFRFVKEALASAGGEELVIIDTPGGISDAVAEIAAHATFLVQPTSPSLDDLFPAVLVFRALERVGVSRDQLAFALCRTLADEEASNARAYLSGLGYAVLAGDIPERLDYRNAMSQGRAITEASQELLSARADTTIGDLLARAGCVQQQPTTEPKQRLSGTA